MTIWRLHIRPKVDNEGAFEYCLKNKIIGTGWAAPSIQEETTDKEVYRSKAPKKFQSDKSWHSSLWSFIDDVSPGDFIWTMSPKGEYYIAVIRRKGGEWRYLPKGEAFDVVNVRKVILHKVGLADSVPGVIRNAFAGPGQTFRKIPSDLAKIFTEKWIQKKRTKKTGGGPSYSKHDIYGLLGPRELEDLVFIYLQSKGWLIVPSTRTSSQIYYEAVLLNKNTGEPAMLQVKSGKNQLDAQSYHREERVFLFAASNIYGTGRPPLNVTIISRNDIERFIRDKRYLLPQSIGLWFELAGFE